jgi:general stress protein 26
MNNLIIQKSLAIVDRSIVGILSIIDEKGIPQQKAMMKTESYGLHEFWFCSNTSSRKVKQIQANPKASLYFMDEKTFEGLMLAGKAKIIYDDIKRKEFWNDDMKKYYPLGCTDPDYVLIKFTSVRGNYYHGLKNTDFET